MGFLSPRLRWYDWRTYRAMYRSRGAWYPSMGVFACLFLFLMSSADAAFARLVTKLWLGSLLVACVLFGVALVGAAVRSRRTIVRMGIAGWRRPRWWFEWANLAWSLMVLVILALAPVVALGPKMGLGALADAAFRVGRPGIAASFWIFLAASAMGYVVSLLGRRPKMGNGYACVQFAFPLVGGIGLVTIASVNWPAGAARPPLAMVLLGGLGGAILIIGMWELVQTNLRPRVRRRSGGFQ